MYMVWVVWYSGNDVCGVYEIIKCVVVVIIDLDITMAVRCE